MSEDLTNKLPGTDSDKIDLILTTVQSLEIRVDRLEVRFDGLEKKVDERLHDIRPIWQKVVADIAQLQEGQTRLENEVHDIKISMREISYQVSGIGDTLVRFHGKNKELEERVRDLERHQHKPTNSST